MPTDAELGILHEKLRKLSDMWALDLIPGNVECRRHFHPTVADFLQDAAKHITAQTDAYVSVDWRYLRVNIHFNCENLVGKDDSRLEVVVVHELVHAFLDELKPLKGLKVATDWRDHHEHATSSIAYALIAVRDRNVQQTQETASRTHVRHQPEPIPSDADPDADNCSKQDAVSWGQQSAGSSTAVPVVGNLRGTPEARKRDSFRERESIAGDYWY